MRRIAPTLLALALVLPPIAARADDDEKADKEKASPTASAESTTPELHFPPPSTRWKLIAGGVLLTGAAWGISYACAYEWPYIDPSRQPTVPTAFMPLIPSGPPGMAGFKIPIVGPWIALGESGCGSDETSCGVKIGVRAAAYVLDGIVQAAGLALIAEGIFMKTEAPVETDKKSVLMLHFRGVEVMPVPVVSASMSGLGLAGTF